MLRIFPAIALVGFLGACALGPSQLQIDAAEAKGRTPGKISVGDEPWYVQTQWGQPYEIHRSLYGDMDSVWWDYCIFYQYVQCYASVHFIDNKVYAIHQ